jgi:protocatechuate 4,5-dioxygenase alpha chain
MCNTFEIPVGVSPQADPEGTEPRNPINEMCRSLDLPDNRVAFLANEEAYCLKFGLNRQQRAAVKERDFLAMIDAGGRLMYLNRLAAVLGLNTLEAIVKHAATPIDTLLSRLLHSKP